MALGTNYKRIEGKNSPIARRIRAHNNRTKALIAMGYSKVKASQMAFKELKEGTLEREE